MQNIFNSFTSSVVSLDVYNATINHLLQNMIDIPKCLCDMIEEYSLLWTFSESLFSDMILVNRFSRYLFNFNYWYLYDGYEFMINGGKGSNGEINSVWDSRISFSHPFLFDFYNRTINVNDDYEDVYDVNDNKQTRQQTRDQKIFLCIRLVAKILEYFQEDQDIFLNSNSIAILISEKTETSELLEKRIYSNYTASENYDKKLYYIKNGSCNSYFNDTEIKFYNNFNVGMILSCLSNSNKCGYYMGRWLTKISIPSNDVKGKSDRDKGNGDKSDNNIEEMIPLICFIHDGFKIPIFVNMD